MAYIYSVNNFNGVRWCSFVYISTDNYRYCSTITLFLKHEPLTHTRKHIQRKSALVFIHHCYVKHCLKETEAKMLLFLSLLTEQTVCYLVTWAKIWTVHVWKAGEQKLGPTHPLLEWMAIISMRLLSSTLQCSDTQWRVPRFPLREALLFGQHLDLTSLHLRLMTPLSCLPFFSPILNPSLPLLASTFFQLRRAAMSCFLKRMSVY